MLGIALGVSFAVCFVTGLLSHLIQDPPSWFQLAARARRASTASPRASTS